MNPIHKNGGDTAVAEVVDAGATSARRRVFRATNEGGFEGGLHGPVFSVASVLRSSLGSLHRLEERGSLPPVV